MVTKIKDNNNIRLIIPAQVGARTSLEGKNVPGQESTLWRTIAASHTIPVQAEQEAARARPKPDHILEIEVAQALAQRAGIKNPPVVRSFNGVITLRGKIENEVALDAAE
ncbi:MAG TPA: hypothetical protein VH186_23360 [Chloroflexia bacterium]|nr:hypothetical protein [Chloroflexia bacterium]